MQRIATGQPEKRVTASYTDTTWALRCIDCDALLVSEPKPVDTIRWVHALQAHPCNDFYYSAGDRDRHARICTEAHS